MTTKPLKHSGIEIRAEIDGQPILETNSYTLHLFGKLGRYQHPGGANVGTFPPAPKGWGYLLGMPFAPCAADQKSPVLSILFRAAEIDLGTYEDDEPEDQAEDAALEGWTVYPCTLEGQPRMVMQHECGWKTDLITTASLWHLIGRARHHNAARHNG